MNLALIRGLAMSLTLAAVTGCASSAEPDASGSEFPFETGPSMFPGDNCRSCHGAPASRYPSAPAWTVAGTVYEGPDSEVGAEGVTVHVTDAQGTHLTLLTNSVGNFYTSEPLFQPLRVGVDRDGVRIDMPVPPPAGGCNACHAQPASGAAPGRLFVPRGGEYTSGARCDGAHTVRFEGDEQVYDCAPYRCTTDPLHACRFDCVDDGHCVAPAKCQEGRCSNPN
jgi:hypothetical protein